MNKTSWYLGGLVTIVGLGFSVSPPAAEACMHGMAVAADPVPMAVSQAERLADGPQPELAVNAIRQVDPGLASLPVGQSFLGDRAKRVLARVAARTNGRARLGIAVEAGPSEGLETRRMAFMAQTLKDLMQGKAGAGDPTLRSDLGELLAELPDGRSEAMSLLSALESADLMASGHAYGALARLRSEGAKSGPAVFQSARAALDHGRIAIELGRCQNMTKVSEVCSLEKTDRTVAQLPLSAPPKKKSASADETIFRL